MNPVELIERLQKAKQEFKMLMKQSDEIELKQKVYTKCPFVKNLMIAIQFKM